MKLKKLRKISRRNAMILIAGFTGTAILPSISFAQASQALDRINEITKGLGATESDIWLDLPEIAENGNTVPISVESKKASAIKILALGNPGPDVVTFKFGPLSATRSASTRIRLRKTQDVLAIAKLEDGSFIQDIQKVKVTIGGCGG